MTDHVTVADGKYTVINDNGKLTALRNGEPWARDLVGDNLVYWMMVEILKQQEQIESLQEALGRITDPRNVHFSGDAQVIARAALQETAP